MSNTGEGVARITCDPFKSRCQGVWGEAIPPLSTELWLRPEPGLDLARLFLEDEQRRRNQKFGRLLIEKR